MHELGLAQGILQIARDHLPAGREADLSAVRVRVGRLAAIVPDSLAFCFEALVQGTPLAAVRLEIDEVPIRIRCTACGRDAEVEGPILVCPGCGGGAAEVLSGTELQVVEIEVRERPAEVP